ncbi:ATP-binding protein [Halorientalis litorea]|uniref:ATP-binding protein n=1 Tax=Halorientalis litorea TaxID=2931977 RepID=UPI001FF2430F|nr:ATP-binding protein [Halorientalis litorea]
MGLRRQVGVFVICSIGLLLAGVILFDMYADWALEGKSLWSTVIENALPLGLALALPTVGFRLARSDFETEYVVSVAWWTAVGFLIMGGVASTVIGFQLLQGELKPQVLAVQTTIVGTVGGLLVGYRTANLRRAQTRVSAEKERWQSLFENDFTSIVDINVVGEKLVVEATNDRFDALAGVTAENAVGRPLFEVTEPYAEDAEATLRNHIVEGRLFSTETSYRTTEGTKHFKLRLVPYNDGRAFLIYQDETDIIEAQQELEAAVDQLERSNEQLEQSNEQLEQFASVVSHDLRNPLNVARSTVELLTADADPDAAPVEHYERLDWAHERMETLIDDMLALARQGKSVSEVEAVDLGALAAECWRTVEADDATLNIAVEKTIEADPNRLRQLFENLFRNSIEHGSTDSQRSSSADGSVEDGSGSDRSAGDAAGTGVTIRVLEIPGGFAVADDGPGIPEDERDHVFETGYTTGGGTGFGLSIVADIAEAHGWDVSVTESEDGGARFEITGVETV